MAFGGYVEPFGLLGVGFWVVRWGEVIKVGEMGWRRKGRRAKSGVGLREGGKGSEMMDGERREYEKESYHAKLSFCSTGTATLVKPSVLP